MVAYTALALAAFCVPILQAQKPAWPATTERLGLATGSGNFDEGSVSALHTTQLEILRILGATTGRVNIRPMTYLIKPKDWTQFNVTKLDGELFEVGESHHLSTHDCRHRAH